MLEQSLRKYGAGRSIVVDKNGIDIAGNKTWEVWSEIANEEDLIVVQSDGRKLVVVQRTDLDMEEDPAARELSIFDNQTSAVSLSWDAFNLAAMAGMGIDLSVAFTKEEITAIVAEEEIALKFEDSEASGFAGAAKEGTGFEITVPLNEEQASNEALKSELKAFCEKYGLTYRMRVAS